MGGLPRRPAHATLYCDYCHKPIEDGRFARCDDKYLHLDCVDDEFYDLDLDTKLEIAGYELVEFDIDGGISSV